MSDTKPLMTTAQVANHKGVSARTVLRMATEGRLPHALKLPTKTGGYLFDPDVVARVFAQQADTELQKQPA